MTLYDVNQQGYHQLPKMTSAEIDEAKKALSNYFLEEANVLCQHFMLLCNERRDYTVFAKTYKFTTKAIADELISIMQSRGTLKAVEFNKEDGTVDFWVSIDDTAHLYKLFPYEWGVIKV